MTDQEDQNALLDFLLSIIDNEDEKKVLEQIFNSVKLKDIIEDFIDYKNGGIADD